MPPLSEFFLNGLLRTAASLAAQVSPRVIDLKKISRTTNIAYGADSEFKTLDIYRPVGTENQVLPISILVHGGGFGYFSKDSHAAAAAALTRQGQLVFSIDYRLAPKAPYPAALMDMAEAYQWVVVHANEHKGDVNNISIVGESAGGNLALAFTLRLFGIGSNENLTCMTSLPRPKHLVIHCGHLHVSGTERYWKDSRAGAISRTRARMVQRHYLPDSFADPTKKWGLADPLIVLEDLATEGKTLPAEFPPVFIPVGALDPVIGDSERLSAALKKLNAREHYEVYPGVSHAFYAFTFLKQAQRCWNEIGVFLNSSVKAAIFNDLS